MIKMEKKLHPEQLQILLNYIEVFSDFRCSRQNFFTVKNNYFALKK